MKFQNVRVLAFAKRLGLRALRFREVAVVSLIRQERRQSVLFEILDNYSKRVILEFIDPRSDTLRGHYFHPRNIYRLFDITLEPKQGLIYTARGDLLDDSTSWESIRVYNSFPWNPGTRIPKAEVRDAIILTSNSYYHWLIEDLPSTIHLLNSFPESPIVVATSHPSYVREFLKTVDRQIVVLDDVAKFESILLVGKGKDCGWPHPVDVLVLRNYPPFASHLELSNKLARTYISRRNSSRSPVNENEVEEIFMSYGFDIVILEEMSLEAQIKVISSSSIIAGIHGAGLTNSVWLSPGSKVLDIANEDYWTECFHRLCLLSNVEYLPFIYEGDFKSSISISKLEFQIRQLLR